MLLVAKRSLLEKMEKLSKEPYKSNWYAETYNKYWVTNKEIKPSIDLEVALVQNLLKNKNSWCDVACGTGYHLQNTNTNAKKVGIDKSKHMLTYAKDISDSSIEYRVEDIVTLLNISTTYDLVTNFGYGYSHQETLPDVLLFIKKLSALVCNGGDLLIGYDSVPEYSSIREWDNGLGVLKVKAIITDYYQNTGTDYLNCISPTKETIIETLIHEFTTVEIVTLPVTWKKTLLHFKGKQNGRR